jgi:hypothetical protein
MITWGERPNGYRTTTNPLTDIVGYKLTGVIPNTFSMARTLASVYSPMLRATGYGNLYRNQIEATEIALGCWDIDCHYGAWQRKEPVAGDMGWSFVTTGGTKHITQALDAGAFGNGRVFVPSGKTAANFKGAIGVTQDGNVEGADVPAYAFKWTEQWKLPLAGAYAWSFAQLLANLTGCCNNSSFRTFAAQEVLFEGAEGSLSVKDPTILEVTLHFSRQPSLTNLVIGDITVTNVAGFQLVWVHYMKGADDGASVGVQKPNQANVENVIPQADFSLLGLGIGPPIPFGLGTMAGQ